MDNTAHHRLFRPRPRRAVILATVATLLALAGATLTATAAQAENVSTSGGQLTGTITYATPTTKTATTPSVKVEVPGTLTVTGQCPADPVEVAAGVAPGYNEGHRIYLSDSSGNLTYVGFASGLMSVQSASSFTYSTSSITTNLWAGFLDPLSVGAQFKLLVSCDFATVVNPPAPPTFPAGNAGLGSSPYFALALQYDGPNSSSVDSWEPASVVKTTPTVSLAGVAHNDGSVQLTATVKNSSGTATDAAGGQVVFTQTQPTSATPTDVTVTNSGTATLSIPASALTAGTTYTYTASYSAGSNANYNDSADSPVASVNVTAATPVAPVSTPLTVTIPSALVAGLTLSVASGGLTLTGSQGGTIGANFTASGALPTVTVTDNRSSKDPWSLDGVASALTGTPSGTIAANSLGWSALSAADGGAAGLTAGSTATDLSTSQVLASWSGTSGSTVTSTIGATVNLNAPASTPAGSYSGTITLTLI